MQLHCQPWPMTTCFLTPHLNMLFLPVSLRILLFNIAELKLQKVEVKNSIGGRQGAVGGQSVQLNITEGKLGHPTCPNLLKNSTKITNFLNSFKSIKGFCTQLVRLC